MAVKTTNMGSMFRLTYSILFKKNVNQKEFIDALRCRNGNLEISLFNEATTKATEQAAASSETITFSSDKITCSDSDVSIEDNVITISKTGNYTVSGSNTILTQDTSKTYNCVIISCPELKEGSTYTLTTASTSQEFTPSSEAVQNN